MPASQIILFQKQIRKHFAAGVAKHNPNTTRDSQWLLLVRFGRMPFRAADGSLVYFAAISLAVLRASIVLTAQRQGKLSLTPEGGGRKVYAKTESKIQIPVESF